MMVQPGSEYSDLSSHSSMDSSYCNVPLPAGSTVSSYLFPTSAPPMPAAATLSHTPSPETHAPQPQPAPKSRTSGSRNGGNSDRYVGRRGGPGTHSHGPPS